MAKSRSIVWASRKASTASSYWKLWRAVTPRRKAGCAAGEPELGKRMGDKTTSAMSANGTTAAMLACAPRAQRTPLDRKRRMHYSVMHGAQDRGLYMAGVARPEGGPRGGRAGRTPQRRGAPRP